MFRLGLIVNPLAGLGGTVGFKGSDGLAQEALAMGAVPKAGQRTKVALSVFMPLQSQISMITCPGAMGETVLTDMGWPHELIDLPVTAEHSTAQDTQQAALLMKQLGVDLILFAGGDGTARDICAAVGDCCPVLGIPAGVKIHSAVYGITPQASGEVVKQLVTGQLVDLKTQDVRDIDEAAFRNNQVKAKLFGEMLVPESGQFVQAVKQGGIEHEVLVLDDMSHYLANEMQDDVLYFVGSGKTTAHLMEYLALPNTLLGVDAVCNGSLIQADLCEADMLKLLSTYPDCKIIISVIGGQGHVLGRGNQQISAAVIKLIGRENLMILCSKTKLLNLHGRPLIVDTGDTELDKQLAGHIEVITGYQDKVFYPIK